MINRRQLLNSAAAAALTGCATKNRTAISPVAVQGFGAALPIHPIHATPDRMFRVTVCLRPFRAAGPRLDIERVGDQMIIHNYGHGGSGWSLSWGSSSIAAANAMRFGERDIGVIGCGALGLTSAILLQRAGANVTIYAKERPPDVRSARATGMWSPDSRIALTNAVSPDFPSLWEKMARASFRMHESYFGIAGKPVELMPQYILSDSNVFEQEFEPQGEKPLPFAEYEKRIPDLTPRFTELPSGTHPFPTRHAWQTSGVTFNIAGYARQLVTDFLLERGRIERKEFQAPSDLRELPQKVLINASGYGARALWRDNSIIPVRGQIAWLIPQPELHYGLLYKRVGVLARRDGIVVQAVGKGDMEGYNDANEEPDRAEAETAVRTVAELYDRMRRPRHR